MANKAEWAKYANKFGKLAGKNVFKTLGWLALGGLGTVKAIATAFDAGEYTEAEKVCRAAAECDAANSEEDVCINGINFNKTK